MNVTKLTGTLAIAAVMLIGCSSGDGGSGISAAKLSTVEDVAGQAGGVTEIAAALDSLAGVGGSGGTQAASSYKALSECPNGGTEDVSTTTKDAGSPFTEQQFESTVIVWDQCARTSQHQSPNGFLSTELILDGQAEGGEAVESPPTVLYQQSGVSEDDPLNVVINIAAESQQGNVTSAFEYDVYSRRDATDANPANSDRAEYWHRMNLEGSAELSTESQSGSENFRFNVEAYVGSPLVAFVVTSDPADENSQSIDGEYGFRIFPQPRGARCHNGRGRVATTERLRPDPEMQSGSPYTDGTLQLESNGRTATVEFNDDGTVTVTDSRGRSETMPYSEFASHSQACSGLAFGAFASFDSEG